MKALEAYVAISVKAKDFAFMKTLPFTKEGLDELRELLDFLEKQIAK